MINLSIFLIQPNFRKKNYKIKFIFKFQFFLIILLIFIFLVIILISFSINIRVCICALGKNENKYIREFVEYYKQYGIDKIFLYDNNDINGEYFQQVVNDYIKNKYIDIINFRGKKHIQVLSYRDCYKKNFMLFDWFIIIDLDEFIYLKNYNNIKTYLRNKKFKTCQVIHLNFIYYTDNNLLHYDNRTLKERFTLRAKYAREPNIRNIRRTQIKSIIRGKIPNFYIYSIHIGTNRYDIYNICNGDGEKYNGYLKSDFNNYYFIHYFSKSTQEFINKIKRGDAIYGSKIFKNIKKYFFYNNITLEKINMFEKELKINLSKYRKKINRKIY